MIGIGHNSIMPLADLHQQSSTNHASKHDNKVLIPDHSSKVMPAREEIPLTQCSNFVRANAEIKDITLTLDLIEEADKEKRQNMTSLLRRTSWSTISAIDNRNRQTNDNHIKLLIRIDRGFHSNLPGGIEERVPFSP